MVLIIVRFEKLLKLVVLETFCGNTSALEYKKIKIKNMKIGIKTGIKIDFQINICH